jgi:CRISPR-associated protein Cas2
MFRSLPGPPGYEIRTIGPTRKALTEISGLQLVIETLKTP